MKKEKYIEELVKALQEESVQSAVLVYLADDKALVLRMASVYDVSFFAQLLDMEVHRELSKKSQEDHVSHETI